MRYNAMRRVPYAKVAIINLIFSPNRAFHPIFMLFFILNSFKLFLI